MTEYSLPMTQRERANHYEKTPIQIYRKFHSISDVFHISAQNIDCGYSLEPPRRGSCNGYPQSIFSSKK